MNDAHTPRYLDEVETHLGQGLHPDITDSSHAFDASGNDAYPNGDPAPYTRITR